MILFEDREDAGRRLAELLQPYRGRPEALVLGLARGGVIVAGAVAERLGLDFDAYVSVKLRTPGDSELAYGAITEDATTVRDSALMRWAGIGREEDAAEGQRAYREALWRRDLYRGGRSLPAIRGRTVILVDDGLATGCTFLAAAEALAQRGPARIVGAVPVGPEPVVRAVRGLIEGLYVLAVPGEFEAVGAFYRRFPPVSHEGVLRRLARGHAPRAGLPHHPV